MAISKPRGKSGARQVFCYDPSIGRKRYVGSRVKLRGPGGAEELEREKKAEFASSAKLLKTETSIRVYAEHWLEHLHGPGTRRLAETTRKLNAAKLKPFLHEHGDKPVDAGIRRAEALAWSRLHPHNARVVSAMFNDAIDEELTTANPFAARRHTESRGRKDIHPLTEQEVDRLARIALTHWGEDGYGLVARAWVLFAAWVGCRPGETFSVTAADLDFKAGEARIRRVKRRGGEHPVDVVVFPVAAQDAVRAMPRIPSSGPVFTTVTGRRMDKGSLRYHWDGIRAAFRQTVESDRWQQLCEGQPDLALYSLRHFCASIMVDRGLNEFDVANQLGHSPEMARQTYIHAHEDRARDRIRRALDGTPVVDIASRRKTG